MFASIWFLGDGVVLGQGLLSFFLLLIGVTALLVLLLEALVQFLRHRVINWYRIGKLAIVLVAAGAAPAYVGVNNKLADRRVLKVAAACDQYKLKHNRYPHDLNELVPEFLPSVPRAKYVFMPMWSQLYYYPSEEGAPILYYYAIPPFGRPIYHLQSKTWTYID